MPGKIAVYTAPFGSSVTLMPQKKFPGVDFICFADKPRNAKGWTEKIVPLPVENDFRRSSRYYKTHPHIFLKEYDYSIWIDANIILIKSPELLIKKEMLNADMLGFDHSQTIRDPRNCIYEEYEALINLKDKSGSIKDDAEVMKRQIEMIRADGYPANNGLIKSCVLVRKHNEQAVIKLMDNWWRFIKNLSNRDQLSFNYVAWKNNFNIRYLKGDARRNNEWFYMVAKTDKHLFYTLMKYRLRQKLKWLKK